MIFRREMLDQMTSISDTQSSSGVGKMAIIKTTLTILLVSVLFATYSVAVDEPDPRDYRLENKIIPKKYEIYIEPQFKGQDFDSFRGNVTIFADVIEEVTEFKIHVGCNMEVDNSSLRISSDGNEIEVTMDKHEGYGDCEVNIKGKKEGNDFYVINVSKPPLKPSKNLELFLPYKGNFSQGMTGFYKSYYSGEEIKEQVLLTTHFEPTHARKAFPCFDEPGFKAQFTLTFEVPRDYHVISNAKEVEKGDYDEKSETHTVSFKKTTRMSTYLVAFIVYNKKTFIKTADREAKIPTWIRTWGRKQEIDERAGELSQEYVPLILDSMANYSGISYLLTELDEDIMPNKPEKVDLVAIPDLLPEAMENWGLVTYRETDLLYKEGKHSETVKKQVVEVTAHELAHQWFGNLVTTKWWNSAWLNEGFATLFECHLTEDVTHGNWRRMERFIAENQIIALGFDAYDTAPPLTIDKDKLLTGSQASEHFGAITYIKGASVLRMFQNMVGPDKFREALQKYLKKMAGKAAEPADLFEELDKVSEENLTPILERWTTRSGFPLISVVEGEKGVIVSQKRYLIGKQDNVTKYDVKITLSVNDGEDKQFWLYFDKDSEEVQVPGDKWLLVKTTGFFRVKYSDKNWKLLLEELKKGEETKIEPVERAVLVDNALNLARFGELDYGVAIDVLNYLQKENDFIPWYTATTELNSLHHMLVNSKQDQGNTINKYIQRLIEHVYKHVQENKEGHIAKVHRANIFNWACRVGYEACLKEVQNAFPHYISGNGSNDVDPDIMNTVYCYGVKTNDTAWLQLRNMLEKKNDATINLIIISALGCSKNQTILAKYLDSGILQNAVRSQDAPAVFFSVYSNPDGTEVAFQFLETRIKKIQENVGTVMDGLGTMISGIAQYLTTESLKERMKAVGEKEESVKVYIQAALNTIQANMDWKNKHETNVLKLLREKMPGSV